VQQPDEHEHGGGQEQHVREHGHPRGHDGVVVAPDDPVRHGYPPPPPPAATSLASSLSARRQRRKHGRVAARERGREEAAGG